MKLLRIKDFQLETDLVCMYSKKCFQLNLFKNRVSEQYLPEIHKTFLFQMNLLRNRVAQLESDLEKYSNDNESQILKEKVIAFCYDIYIFLLCM